MLPTVNASRHAAGRPSRGSLTQPRTARKAISASSPLALHHLSISMKHYFNKVHDIGVTHMS